MEEEEEDLRRLEHRRREGTRQQQEEDRLRTRRRHLSGEAFSLEGNPTSAYPQPPFSEDSVLPLPPLPLRPPQTTHPLDPSLPPASTLPRTSPNLSSRDDTLPSLPPRSTDLSLIPPPTPFPNQPTQRVTTIRTSIFTSLSPRELLNLLSTLPQALLSPLLLSPSSQGNRFLDLPRLPSRGSPSLRPCR